MQESTPILITPEQFNVKVRGWTVSVRQRMAANAPKSTGVDSPFRTEPKLAASLSHKISKTDDISTRIKYQFSRHGVFVHYGAGRGQGGTKGTQWQTRTGITKKTNRNSLNKMGRGSRQPVDWFDVEIRTNIDQLAEFAQEFYGDWALEDMLSKIDKYLIQKK